IKANDSISIAGHDYSGGSIYPSGIISETYGKGDAGSITIETAKLSLSDVGRISTSSEAGSDGNAGSITIKAGDSISIAGYYDNGKTVFPSGILSETYGKGNAGNISIESSRLTITDVGGITTSAEAGSGGNGGSINIKAGDSISISGHYDRSGIAYLSRIISDTYGKGDAGSISIETSNLSLSDSGQISTTARAGSGGNGGSISINAGDSISVAGHYDNGVIVSTSGILSETYGKGNAGDIGIDTAILSLSALGLISTSAGTGSGGNAGSITIKAGDSISIAGHYETRGTVYLSKIVSETFGKGDAGSINIETAKLSLSDVGRINTSAEAGSGGSGGNISITSSDSISVAGQYDSGGTIYHSGILSETVGKGKAGSITVGSNSISLSEGGMISTSTSGSGAGGDIEIKSVQMNLYSGSSIASESFSTGVAGSITIKAGDTIKMTDSSITTATADADGGNISIDPQLMDIRNSSITATVHGGTGNGGNIVFNSDQVVLEGSRVIANAELGNGGSINIKSDVFIKTSDSTVSASSRLGLQGTVAISAPLVDLSGNLAVLPAAYIDTGALFPKPCASREEEMSIFVVKGRDGVPPQPDSPLGSGFCPGGMQ
ncbi:MAG: S-layer family protein, partial [Nitrospirae bacterium]|nr:S-layer family protein [Nitrospirota bacterium]